MVGEKSTNEGNKSKPQKLDIISELKNNENIKEVYEKLVQEVLKKYVGKILSSEGINLSKDSIYNDITSLLDEIESSLDENNIFSNKIKILKDNFLSPKQKALKFIELSIKMFLGEKNEKNEEENLNLAFDILKSSLGALIDISQKSSKKEIQSYVKEIKNIGKLKKIFEKIPDLERLLIDIIPGIINSIDKKIFLNDIDIFLIRNKGDLLSIYKGNYNDNNLLNVITGLSKLSNTLINKDSVNSFIESSIKLDSIKNNDIAISLFNLIKNSSLSIEEKVQIAKKTIGLVELLTDISKNESEIENYANDLIKRIVGLKGKIDDQQISNFLLKIIGKDNDNGIDIDINQKELIELISDNVVNKIKKISLKSFFSEINNEINSINLKESGKQLIDAIKKMVNTDFKSLIQKIKEKVKNNGFSGILKDFLKKSTKEKLINFLIKGYTIEENIKMAGGKLISRIKKVINADLGNIIGKIRHKITENIKIGEENLKRNKDKEKDNTFSGKLLSYIEVGVKTIISDKLKKGGRLKKEEIIDSIKESLNRFLEKEYPLLIEYIKDLGIKIEGSKQEKILKEIIKNIINHPDISKITEKVISSFGEKIKNSDEIVNDFGKIFKEVIGSNGKNILSTEVISSGFDLGIDIFYSSIAKNEKQVKVIFEILSKNLEIDIPYKKDTIGKIVILLKENISSDKLKNIIGRYPKIKDFNFKNIDLNSLFLDIFNEITDKTKFISSLKEIGIIEEFSNNSEKQGNIDESSISLGIDLLYSTIDDSNYGELGGLIDEFKQYFPSELVEINILGQSLGKNLELILRNITKEKLKYILLENIIKINELKNNELNENEKFLLFGEIGQEIVANLDVKQIQKKLRKSPLNENEKLSVELFDEIKEIVNEDKWNIQELTEKGLDLYEFYKSGKKIESGSTQEKNIKSYGEELFSLINKFIGKLGKGFLKKNLKISESKDNDSKFTEILKSSFISENKLFLLSEIIPFLIGDFNIGKSIDSYFLDISNKENFGDTLLDFFIDSREV